MKKIQALLCVLVFFCSAAQAANYCDSKKTQQAVNACYRQSIINYKNGMDKALSDLIAMPGQTAQSKAEITTDQTAWESRVKSYCKDFACLESQFIGRILQINRLKEQRSKIINQLDSVDPNQCFGAWVDAYRKEEGDEAIVTNDQSTEWESLCRKGKRP